MEDQLEHPETVRTAASEEEKDGGGVAIRKDSGDQNHLIRFLSGIFMTAVCCFFICRGKWYNGPCF